MSISLLLPVYVKDNPDFFREALESVALQTKLPHEVVVVCDGPITSELRVVLEHYRPRLPLKIVESKENVGLARALNLGIQSCDCEWIARFDADDLCVPSRLEVQWNFVLANPDTDVLGGAIAEFDDDPNVIYGYRRLPTSDVEIEEFAKSRNPINHMTAMFKKNAVVAVGMYPNQYLYEDYVLWVNMLAKKYVIRNLPDVLVLARAGRSMAERRGGVSYVRSEVAAQRYFLSIGFISLPRFLINISIRTFVRLIPDGVRYFSYKKFLRS